MSLRIFGVLYFCHFVFLSKFISDHTSSLDFAWKPSDSIYCLFIFLFSPQKSSPESLKYQIIPQLEHRKKGKREELWAQGFSQKVAVTRNSTCNEVQPADYKIFFFDNHVDYFPVFVLAVLVTHTKITFQSNVEHSAMKGSS